MLLHTYKTADNSGFLGILLQHVSIGNLEVYLAAIVKCVTI